MPGETMLERLTARIAATDGVTPNQTLLADCIESAKAIYLSLRFPYTPDNQLPAEVEQRYQDWQYRAALEIYSKAGAEGQSVHSENGISRTWDSSGISESLKREIVPKCGVIS
jgi:hypothetical protein